MSWAFQPPRYAGKFIVIEGLDGAGSTTQAARLATRLRKAGFKVIRTREPSDGPGGIWIRQSLANRLDLDSKTRTLLFAADRVDHLHNKFGVLSLLKDPDTVVVCERYLLSFFAYQSFDMGESFDWLETISAQCVLPTVTVWIDVPPQECMRRIVSDRGFHQELYESYRQLAEIRSRFELAANFLQSRGTIVRQINGEGAEKQVAERVRTVVDSLLLSRFAPRTEWDRILRRNRRAAQFVEEAERAGLDLEIREIQAGVQVRVFDETDVVNVNIYDTGRLIHQGAPTRLRSNVGLILDRLQRAVLFDRD